MQPRVVEEAPLFRAQWEGSSHKRDSIYHIELEEGLRQNCGSN